MQFEHTNCNSWHKIARNDYYFTNGEATNIKRRANGEEDHGCYSLCCCCRLPEGCCEQLKRSTNFSMVDSKTIRINSYRFDGRIVHLNDQSKDSTKKNQIRPNYRSHRRNTVLILLSKQRCNLRLFSQTRTHSLLLFLCLTILFTESLSLMIDRQYIPTTNKTGQFSIAQLCPRLSSIPVTRRVEGAALVSTYSDVDVFCTITFRTKTAHQHFIIRFEELKLGCEDHLVLFDGDADYGQASIHDYSCRDNMASVRDIRTTGSFLTIKYKTDNISQPGDGFRIVVTAVFDTQDCPSEYAYCRDHYCISRLLFCDGIIHCLDGSDEDSCHKQEDPNDLPYALGLLVILVLAISTCVIIFIATIYCRRESPYAQYQHQLQRTFGVPLQTSSSIMFPNNHHQTQYQFFQPTQMSPYVTPQHHALIAAAATLPRGYSTLPLNYADTAIMAGRQQAYPQTILAKANFITANSNELNQNNNSNLNKYLMMSNLGAMQSNQQQPQMNALANLPTSTAGQPVVITGPMQQTTAVTSLPYSQSQSTNTTPRHSSSNTTRGNLRERDRQKQ